LQSGTLEVSLPEGKTVICGGETGPQACIHFHSYEALDRIVSHGDIGLGETYMEGLWDTDDLKSLMRIIADNYDTLKASAGSVLYKKLYMIKHNLRPNSRAGSRKNIHAHYDLGNDFYKLWLDDSMTYSCALFQGDPEKSLEEAQKAKYHRILGRLKTEPSSHILEIGCGWGGFMAEAARQGHRITGVTISSAQAKLARERLAQAGLNGRTELRLQDYRDIAEQYDHVVSIGMMEHVGEAYWPEYMAKIHNSLKPGGNAMIQSIITPDESFEDYRKDIGFIREHIFPGGMLPSPSRFQEEALKAGLEVMDIFKFGRDYAITLGKWLERFDNNIHAIMAMGYNDEFIRKWRFYLASCAAMFGAEKISVMQVELRKPMAN
jgi:cyclopropane-fatty-acyl-phospholipid synthase